MPLLKPQTMNDILATPECACNLPGEEKVQISFASSHNSITGSERQNGKKSFAERIPAFGLLCGFLSVFCFSFPTVLVRMYTELPAIEILVARSALQFVLYFIISILFYRKIFFGKSGHRFDLLLRSVSGTIALSCAYCSLRMIPLSDAVTIHSASPVFVTPIAYFMLKESFTKLQMFTGAFTMLGVIILAKPAFLFGTEEAEIHELRFEGTILALISAVFAAMTMVTLRKLKSTPVSVVIMWYSLAVVILGSVFLTATGSWVMPPDWPYWRMLLICGVCGIFAQYLLTLALRYEKAGPISVVRTFTIVLSFIWEVALLDETIQLTSVIGACLVSSCVVLLALVKWNKESPETFEKIRKRCCCCCTCCATSKSPSDSTTSKPITAMDIEGKPITRHNSSESIDSITVQNTVNSNAILLLKSDDEDDENHEAEHPEHPGL